MSMGVSASTLLEAAAWAAECYPFRLRTIRENLKEEEGFKRGAAAGTGDLPSTCTLIQIVLLGV